MPRIIDKAKSRFQQALTIPPPTAVPVTTGQIVKPFTGVGTELNKLSETNQAGFEQRQLAGAPIGAEGFAQSDAVRRGDMPAYATTSPAAQRASRELVLNNGNPQVQNRIREQTMDAVARANTPNAATGGMSPNDFIASKAGTGQPRTPEMQAKADANATAHAEKVATARGHIKQRRDMLAKRQGTNTAGIAYNQMIEAQGWQEQQKFDENQREQQAKAKENAAKQAEKDKPSPSDLKAVYPWDDAEDMTDEKTFADWHGKAMKRWVQFKSGTVTAPEPVAPPTFAGGVAGAKQAWGAVKPQAAPVDPKWEAEVHAAAAQGLLDDQIDALIAQGMDYDEARAHLLATKGKK